MSSTFRPAVESLEDRLTPSGMGPSNIDPLAGLTNAAQTNAYKAYQNMQKLITLYNSVGGAVGQSQNPQTIVSLGGIKHGLAKAKAIVDQEHNLANAMRLVNLAERVYRAHHQAQALSASVPFDDSDFRAWSQDFRNYDNWITTKAVPYIHQIEAWVNSQMAP